MLKSFVNRYKVIASLFLIAILTLTLPRLNIHTGKSITPPAQVIITQASLTGRGVKIVWLAGQQGQYPISGYSVERKRSGSSIKSIGHVQSTSNESFEFVDADGQMGDIYQIITEDNQRPAHISNSSEVVANAARAGANVIASGNTAVSATEQVLGSQTSPTDVKITTLQDLTAQVFKDFDAAAISNKASSAEGILSSLQDYQRQTLSLFPKLSLAQKLSLVRTCLEEARPLEADLILLPKRVQTTGMIVQAGCQAMQDAAQ